MVPKGEFDPAKQYSPGEEVEVTILTVNHSTRRITGSIQHVMDVAPEEIEAYVADGEVGSVTGALESVVE
jgi:ribosomal protein S1